VTKSCSAVFRYGALYARGSKAEPHLIRDSGGHCDFGLHSHGRLTEGTILRAVSGLLTQHLPGENTSRHMVGIPEPMVLVGPIALLGFGCQGNVRVRSSPPVISPLTSNQLVRVQGTMAVFAEVTCTIEKGAQLLLQDDGAGRKRRCACCGDAWRKPLVRSDLPVGV
jgi:hypothetical protein